MAGKRMRTQSRSKSAPRKKTKLEIATKGYVDRKLKENIETKSRDWGFNIPTYYPFATGNTGNFTTPTSTTAVVVSPCFPIDWNQGTGDTQMIGNEVTMTSIMIKGQLGLKSGEDVAQTVLNYGMRSPLKLRLIIFQYTDELTTVNESQILQFVGQSQWNTGQAGNVWDRSALYNMNNLSNIDSGINSMYNRKQKGNFRVHYDKVHNFMLGNGEDTITGTVIAIQTGNAATNLTVPIDLYIPQKKMKSKKLQFESEATGSLYRIGTARHKGAFYAMVLSNAIETSNSGAGTLENNTEFYNCWGFTGSVRVYYKDG